MNNVRICPVCRSAKRVEVSGRLSWTTHARLALLVGGSSYLLSLFSTRETALKALVVYLPLWGLAELVHFARFRESLRCGACGFDPQLYRRDWRSARERIEARLSTEQKKLIDELGARSARLRQRAPGAKPAESGIPTLADRGTTRVVSLNDPDNPT